MMWWYIGSLLLWVYFRVYHGATQRLFEKPNQAWNKDANREAYIYDATRTGNYSVYCCGRLDKSALYTVRKHIFGPVGMQLVAHHYSILVTYCTWSKKLQRFPLLQYALQYHNTFSVCPCGRQTPNLFSLQCEGQLTELYHHELFFLLKMFFSVHSASHTNIFKFCTLK